MFQNQRVVYSNVKAATKKQEACDEVLRRYHEAWGHILQAEEELTMNGMIAAGARATMLREILETEVKIIDDYRSRLPGVSRVEEIKHR